MGWKMMNLQMADLFPAEAYDIKWTPLNDIKGEFYSLSFKIPVHLNSAETRGYMEVNYPKVSVERDRHGFILYADIEDID